MSLKNKMLYSENSPLQDISRYVRNMYVCLLHITFAYIVVFNSSVIFLPELSSIPDQDKVMNVLIFYHEVNTII